VAKCPADVKPALWTLINKVKTEIVDKLDKLHDQVQSYEHALSNKIHKLEGEVSTLKQAVS
jgi:hypothetical protein